MRIAELRRSIPASGDRIPRHGEMAVIPAKHDVRESHDDVRDGEGEEHDEDVEVDEAEPVEEGFPDAVTEAFGEGYARSLLGPGAVGRGRGWRRRVAAVDWCCVVWSRSVWQVVCMGDVRCSVAVARTIE